MAAISGVRATLLQAKGDVNLSEFKIFLYGIKNERGMSRYPESDDITGLDCLAKRSAMKCLDTTC